MKKIKWHIKNILRIITAKIDRKLYDIDKTVIVSNNCFGGEIYTRLGLKFNTPFIGLFIFGSDYIKLLTRIEFYLDHELRFVKTSKWSKKKLEYPVALLNDIEIHFMHYESEKDAKDKWVRRLKRMRTCGNFEDFVYKFCDRDGATFKELEVFHELSFQHKLSFSVNEFPNVNHLQINNNHTNKVPDGVELYVICQRYFDLYDWLISGVLKKSCYSTIKSKLDIA